MSSENDRSSLEKQLSDLWTYVPDNVKSQFATAPTTKVVPAAGVVLAAVEETVARMDAERMRAKTAYEAARDRHISAKKTYEEAYNVVSRMTLARLEQQQKVIEGK